MSDAVRPGWEVVVEVYEEDRWRHLAGVTRPTRDEAVETAIQMVMLVKSRVEEARGKDLRVMVRYVATPPDFEQDKTWSESLTEFVNGVVE